MVLSPLKMSEGWGAAMIDNISTEPLGSADRAGLAQQHQDMHRWLWEWEIHRKLCAQRKFWALFPFLQPLRLVCFYVTFSQDGGRHQVCCLTH